MQSSNCVDVSWWLLDRRPDFDFYAKQFTGPNYYYMYPFKDYMKERLEEEFERIRADRLEPHEEHIKKVLLREA